MEALVIDTPHGPARAHLRLAGRPAGALVLGHAAGGGVGAPDLVAAAQVAAEAGWTVALVEQPYRVAGRRAPAPAAQLDAAWTAVLACLAAGELRDLALVVGGRSSGARVACRTAADTGAAAVLCLAFPLLPPARSPGRAAGASRQPELDAVVVPTLVVQGANDPFGMPPPAPERAVVAVPGDHRLAAGLPELGAAVRVWLPTVVE